ncbi:hypothetical protein [Streptomyces shenzhenensis]|uniref:Uncharacterized protein n=1 Tax=Streptomyces shenzhenensis TaxID=943815 RepID=A0A3M0I8L0_9ACTN|nr:hypothetical protein [Streptomyces shenzhenensis]RMB85577.1 hypothetical protein CTZ28_12335 [Streptomyces shenzhenensis]
MPDNDPYRLTRGPAHEGGPRPESPRVGRALLWLLLVLSATANTVTSLAGAATAVSLACGLVTAACVTGLVMLRLRGRR